MDWRGNRSWLHRLLRLTLGVRTQLADDFSRPVGLPMGKSPSDQGRCASRTIPRLIRPTEGLQACPRPVPLERAHACRTSSSKDASRPHRISWCSAIRGTAILLLRHLSRATPTLQSSFGVPDRRRWGRRRDLPSRLGLLGILNAASRQMEIQGSQVFDGARVPRRH